jgi:hypothetical protein
MTFCNPACEGMESAIFSQLTVPTFPPAKKKKAYRAPEESYIFPFSFLTIPHSVSAQKTAFLTVTILKTLKYTTESDDAIPTYTFMHRGNLLFCGFLNQYMTDVHVLCTHLIVNHYYIKLVLHVRSCTAGCFII